MTELEQLYALQDIIKYHERMKALQLAGTDKVFDLFNHRVYKERKPKSGGGFTKEPGVGDVVFQLKPKTKPGKPW